MFEKIKSKSTLLALSILIAAPVSAENFWIPAERFNDHTAGAADGSLVMDSGRMVQVIGDGLEVRIDIGENNELERFLADNPIYKVCAYLSNYDNGATNTVETMHPADEFSREHTIDRNGFMVRCSQWSEVDPGNNGTAGLKVVSPSSTAVKVRGLSFRPKPATELAEASGSNGGSRLEDYEYSRALGYLFGDGNASGNFLTFLRRNSSVSNHFGSVAGSFFGRGLTTSGSQYRVQLDGVTPARFLQRGVSLSDIPDKRAFFTSIVETEGAVVVGRLFDDPARQRCTFVRDLVNELNPRCSASTCTDGNCSTPNCAFLANHKQRNTPYRPTADNERCGVYLSGDASDWRSLFSGNDYHFVKTDRTPGGQPQRHGTDSRPAYTR